MTAVRADKRVWAALVLGLVLTLPALWVGLQLDDYFHWGLVTQHSPVLQTQSPGSPYGLFSFVDGDPNRVSDLVNLGLLPWWTYPQVEYAFWRPITELTHILDYGLWPRQPWLMHLHSLVYLLLLLGLSAHLLRRLQGDSAAWVWALFLFVVSYTHGVPAGWLANRNAVLATLFLVLTLLAHHRWRQGDRGVLNFSAGLCFAAGLLCGEMAVSTGAYLVAYALWLERGSLWERLMSLGPYLVIGVAWLGMRALLGYGASGSGHYLDPLQNPLLFLQTFAGRGADLLGGLFWVVPPELGSGLPAARRWVYLGLFLLLLAVARPLLRRDARARFWLTGALLCLVPVASTVPHSRLLIAASLGAAGFLGLLLAAWRQGELARGLMPRFLVAPMLGLLLFLHLGMSALLLPLEVVSMRLLGDTYLNSGARNWQLEALPAGTTPVLINPPLSSAGGYINGVRAYYGLPVTAQTWLLASGMKPLQLTVIDEHSLELSAATGLYDAVQEGVLRGPQAPFAVGDQVRLSGLVITVLATEHGAPVRARFQFDAPLHSDRYAFYHWHSGKVAVCVLPPPGTSIELRLDSQHCAGP